ncbi:hypothetical protein INT45_003603 [Circinella minor]|uniref:Tc1-like transposase DDE domain-containing protein n=1 Tax=Circinella minor TaxID=1195481 RepID=A0A8H7RVT6_9FUNG|nr:hypothetical protein INT45_003603 [Circinella minor]
MSTLNTVPEVESGTNVLVNEYNWDVPHEYLCCFNVNDDEIMTEAIEVSTPGLPPIKRLLDLDYYKIHRSIPKAIEIDENASVEKRVNTIWYFCGYSARKAELELGFAVRTAQHYCHQYRLDEDKVLPGKKSQSGGAPKKLFPEHTKFLIEYFEERVTATLWQAGDELCEKFSISVSLIAVHNHLVNHCTVTFKKLEKLPATIITPRVINLLKQVVEEWERDLNMDYMKNCVFIDKAGFNMHLRRNFGRPKIGTPAKAVVPTNRGISINIFSAIYHDGILDLTLRRPQPVPRPKKRKRNNGSSEEVTDVNARVGTRTEHYIEFITGLMDTLDADNMKGSYLVMDNAPIHTNSDIEDSGYKCVYLPPYSPFLNPIQEFWSKVKAGVRRDGLTKDDNLSSRITESSLTVTAEDCQGWIRHAIQFFDRFLPDHHLLLTLPLARKCRSIDISSPVNLIFRTVDTLNINWDDIQITKATALNLPLHSIITINNRVPHIRRPGFNKLRVVDLFYHDEQRQHLFIREKTDPVAYPTLLTRFLDDFAHCRIFFKNFFARLCLPPASTNHQYNSIIDGIDFTPFSHLITQHHSIMNYTTKQYHIDILSHTHNNNNNSQSIKWKLFWQTSMNHSTRKIFFRILHGTLPTASIIYQRTHNFLRTNLCPICQQSIDTPQHFTLQCSSKQAIWTKVWQYFMHADINLNSTYNFFTTCHKPYHHFSAKKLLSFLAIVLCHIWQGHWNHVFNNIPFSAETISVKAIASIQRHIQL